MAKKIKAKDDSLAQNKKARHDYAISDTVEAGIALTGTEIKSVRERRITLRDGFVQVRNDEAYLMNVNISEYAEGNQFNHDPLRNRKLLLHKKQILALEEQTKNKGITIVPLKVYLKKGFAKVLIGVAKGKREYDKRQDIKKRDQQREIERTLRRRAK
ncbi:SsrA-binding protein SmpB [Pediococcus claussenii]|uniref:SsrA-binding protein n=1 Tax=Pediococcus claussenii (strain ATCC BAA-344 / DSM 14800 / JCM 18046 / KCTC 3811 / LMG 21948 / P06) TaxID=701521 RepID=G8PC36_PEDCP|nr:SsrA-binding protein SmpB [Pediococcus claussenii]AEV94855.1 ssrA-binding protein [Pediococcus claussenii ATCC BAA-344]ANZ70051.1 SsrA-binding protein [Pediococcus claussenii]ANZ71866.1 SsrA-binding protein [Pediococcus claussenii]KRN21033.1 smpB protein [Pediococcus claussenii]